MALAPFRRRGHRFLAVDPQAWGLFEVRLRITRVSHIVTVFQVPTKNLAKPHSPPINGAHDPDVRIEGFFDALNGSPKESDPKASVELVDSMR